MKDLSTVESFGGIDADTDSLLARCFQDHEAYVDAIGHRRPFVIGRKGSGKTAIFKKIIGTRAHNIFTFGHTFADYPWHHHRLQELVGVPEEARYVQSWLYLILLTSAKILLNQDQSQPWSERSLEELRRLENFVVDSYGSRDPDVTQLFTPSKRLRIRPHLKFAKDLFQAGLDLESLPMEHLPRFIQEVNSNIAEAVIECLNPEFDYYICFDELDRGFDPKDASYRQVLIGLLLAAKQLNNRARAETRRLSVLVFLRDDIYELLRFEDKNKITENLVSQIEWDSSRKKWTLRELMEKRFAEVAGEGSAVSWAQIFDEGREMPGRQTKYYHIRDRTFRRPRDIIKFCNEILNAYKKRVSEGKFSNEDIVIARDPYSEYLLHELEDEVHKHLPQHERFLGVLRSIGTALFTRTDIENVCSRQTDGKEPLRPVDVLQALFEFSVIGYQRTGGVGGGSEYVWKYLDTRARFDETATNFRVHLGLIEAFNLKRWARKEENGDLGE